MRLQNDDVIIVQVSDLHFGPKIYPHGTTNHASSQLLQRIHGLQPHDIGACHELANTLHQLRLRYQKSAMVLVVAGDLTVMGDDSEFALALTYLGRRLSLVHNRSIGLDGLFDLVLMVPGNHDHWAGRLHSAAVNTAQSRIHGRYFPTDPTRPWIFGEHRIGTGFQMQLMGVDSCDTTNFAARGSISLIALQNLEQRIQHANGLAESQKLPVARLLICHHSLQANLFHALDSVSRQALVVFAQKHKVHRILTGHIHTTCLSENDTSNHAIELRSGTALQSRSKTNEFLVHRLFQVDQELRIRTVPYVRTSGSFNAYAKHAVTRVLHQ